MKSRKENFRKTAHRVNSTEAAYSEHSISIVGYVNAVPAFVCFELPAWEASNCDFWKLTSCDFIAFISLTEVNFCFFLHTCLLKPQDSFGIWWKIKRFIFVCVNAWFYLSVWTINALFIVHSKLVSFSRNNPNIKMFGVPPKARTLFHR